MMRSAKLMMKREMYCCVFARKCDTLRCARTVSMQKTMDFEFATCSIAAACVRRRCNSRTENLQCSVAMHAHHIASAKRKAVL